MRSEDGLIFGGAIQFKYSFSQLPPVNPKEITALRQNFGIRSGLKKTENPSDTAGKSYELTF